MNYKTALIIIIVILILAYPHYSYMNHFHKDLYEVAVEDIKFNTGDIIMTKYETPCFYNGPNGFNIRLFPMKAASDSIQYYYQQEPYTHCALVIVYKGEPYFWHLTDDPNFDEYTKQFTSGTPALCKMDAIKHYRGNAYLFKRTTPLSISDEKIADVMDKIYSQNISIEGNLPKIVLTNGLGVIKNTNTHYLCTDFVEHAMSELGILERRCLNSNISTMMQYMKNHNYSQKPLVLRTGWYSVIYNDAERLTMPV